MKTPLTELSTFLERLRPDEDLPVFVQQDRAAIEQSVADLDLMKPRSLDEALAICGEFLDPALRTTHPRCFGWLTPTPLPEAALADYLVSMANPQLAVRGNSLAAVAAEERVLADLAGFFGFPASAAGVFTSGGSEANLTALVVALSQRIPSFAERGLSGLAAAPTFYVSAESHRSFEKIAQVVGLGRGAMRIVPSTDRFALDVSALAHQLESDRVAGRQPFAVVATAGTTNVGAIDPLPQLADLCAQQGLWLHVDAAWGGIAAISDRLRPLLQGIERADSITFDPHKGLSLPYGTGAVFLREGSQLRSTFQPTAAYVASAGTPADPYCASLQWSRRFIGLRLLMPLLVGGWPAMAQRFEHQAAMADRLVQRLLERDFQIVFHSRLAIVCFVDARPDAVTPTVIARRVAARGRAWLAATQVAGQPALRACVSSYATTERDLDILLDELDAARQAEATDG